MTCPQCIAEVEGVFVHYSQHECYEGATGYDECPPDEAER